MGVAGCALKASQDAGAAIGHDELKVGRCAAEGHQAVAGAAAVFVDVGLKLANGTNQALRQFLGQGRQLCCFLDLAAELHPLHRFVLLRVAASQDDSEPHPVVAEVPACLATAGQRCLQQLARLGGNQRAKP